MLSQPDLTIEVIRKGVAAIQKCQPKQVYVSRAKEMPFARRRCRRATFGPSRHFLRLRKRERYRSEADFRRRYEYTAWNESIELVCASPPTYPVTIIHVLMTVSALLFERHALCQSPLRTSFWPNSQSMS